MELIDFVNQPKLELNDQFFADMLNAYLKVDYNHCVTTSEIYEDLYKYLRVDPKSKGLVNEQDKRVFSANIWNDLINTYGYAPGNILKEQSGFFTYKSWKILNTEKIEESEFRHRFYINCPSGLLMKFANYLYLELKDKQIPFYFKIQNTEECVNGYKDSLVLYTSTKYLEKTLDAFEIIEQKYPQLVNVLNVPSELTGKAKPWLGYGSDPKDVQHSYTSNICLIFTKAIEKMVKKWANEHKDIKIENQTIYDYYLNPNNFDYSSNKKRTQILLRVIVKYDKPFLKEIKNQAIREAIDMGFDPNNLCMTSVAKEEIENYLNFKRR